MKASCAERELSLALALALALPCAAFAERKLPEFRLNSTRVSGLPRFPDGAIPPVPPPTDTGYYTEGKIAGPRLDSSIKVTVDGERGSAEIVFPAAEAGGAYYGFRSSLFVKLSGYDSSSVLSWAAVVCSGREYVGYKGSSLKLPDRSGGFVLEDESLALGPAKNRLALTHPWLAPDSGQALDRLCSRDFPGKMKAYAARALPREADGFKFDYDAAERRLTVTWP